MPGRLLLCDLPEPREPADPCEPPEPADPADPPGGGAGVAGGPQSSLTGPNARSSMVMLP